MSLALPLAGDSGVSTEEGTGGSRLEGTQGVGWGEQLDQYFSTLAACKCVDLLAGEFWKLKCTDPQRLRNTELEQRLQGLEHFPIPTFS